MNMMLQAIYLWRAMSVPCLLLQLVSARMAINEGDLGALQR